MMERALRTSLEMSAGDLSILVTRPISAVLLIVAAIVLLSPGVRMLGKRAGKD
jgi:putative tricarboxylic transport membrane protein